MTELDRFFDDFAAVTPALPPDDAHRAFLGVIERLGLSDVNMDRDVIIDHVMGEEQHLLRYRLRKALLLGREYLLERDLP